MRGPRGVRSGIQSRARSRNRRDEVRRITKEPVQTVLLGTDGDEKSRNLATLARYIAMDFSDKISLRA